MWKQLLMVLVVLVVTCSAENEIQQNQGRGRNPFKHHHHHGLYYLTHYWVFLAIKAKIIFLIGTFISFWVFAGKAFAFLYYYKNKESCRCPEYHHEKIVLPEEPPHYEHKYSTIINSGPPIDFSGPPIEFSGPPKGYSSPPDAAFLHYGNKPFTSTYERYSRSIEDSVFANMDILKSIIKKIDLTELAFSTMKLKKKSCRKRFVCEANQQARNNSLLAITLYMFSDVGLMKYNTNRTIVSVDDCMSLGPSCDNVLR